jgi:hypothetical protein
VKEVTMPLNNGAVIRLMTSDPVPSLQSTGGI